MGIAGFKTNDVRQPAAGYPATVAGAANSSRAMPERADPEPADSAAIQNGRLEPKLSGTAQLLGSVRGWLASTLLHVIAIVGLALLTTHQPTRSVIQLESTVEPELHMQNLVELQFDLANVDSNRSQTMDNSDWRGRLDPVWQEPVALSHADSFGLPSDSDEDRLQDLAGSMRQGLEVATGESESSFFGIEITGNDIVYVVDRSGSMQGHRWASARGELIKSIESLHDKQNFFVFLFSDSCHPMPQLAGRNQLVAATPQNVDKIKTWLLRQNPNGRTKPKGSLMRGMRMDPDTVFLLTDGIFQDETGEFLIRRAQLQQSVSEGQTLVIHTIAFHCRQALHMLQRIAESWQGTFRLVE